MGKGPIKLEFVKRYEIELTPQATYEQYSKLYDWLANHRETFEFSGSWLNGRGGLLTGWLNNKHCDELQTLVDEINGGT